MTTPVSMIERMSLLLDLFDAATPRLTLAELSERSGLPRSTTHRILDQLPHTDNLPLGFAAPDEIANPPQDGAGADRLLDGLVDAGQGARPRFRSTREVPCGTKSRALRCPERWRPCLVRVRPEHGDCTHTRSALGLRLALP